MYYCYIVQLKNVRKHSNADRLLVGDIFGNQVIVGLDYKEGETLAYFGTDGQLSEEFVKANPQLLKVNGGYFEDDRRIRTQKFRGEISDGFACRLDLLVNVVGWDIVNTLKVGDRFDVLNGISICNKYYAKATAARNNKTKTINKVKATKWFPQHFDTNQLAYCVNNIKHDDFIIITEKFHGTSHRVGYVKNEIKHPKWKQLINKVCPIFPTTEYKLMSGTRNVILGERDNPANENLRSDITNYFKDKLNKDELVFLEIVGYDGETPIMSSHDTTPLKDKGFTKKYGEKMVYSYGCKPTQFKMFVYRIAYVTDDGIIVDLTWDQVKKRTEQLGLETPTQYDTLRACEAPRFCKELHIVDSYDELDYQDALLKICNYYGENVCSIDSSHYSEGVCVRAESSFPKIYKHKSTTFKILEGIIKSSDDYVDTEEIS